MSKLSNHKYKYYAGINTVRTTNGEQVFAVNVLMERISVEMGKL